MIFFRKKRERAQRKEILTESLGWMGVILLLAVYIGASQGFIEATSIYYLLGNLIGCSCIAIDARSDGNMQSVMLNVICAIIAVIGLLRYFVF